MGDAPTDGIAVIWIADDNFQTLSVIEVEEARAHSASGYLAKWGYRAREYVAADVVEAFVRRTFVRWTARPSGGLDADLAVHEFMEMLREELPLNNPTPGQTFPEWGCALDL